MARSLKNIPHLCRGCRGGVNSLFSSSAGGSGPADINYTALGNILTAGGTVIILGHRSGDCSLC